MKNYMKNILFVSLIIFSQSFNCSYAGALKSAATELDKGLDEVADSINGVKAEMPNVGVNSAGKVATSLDGIKTEMPNLGVNSAKIAAASMDGAVKAGVFVAIGAGVYVVYREAKKLYRSYNPSTEEQLHEKEVSKKLEIQKAEDELYKSLVAHAAEEKNSRGIPCACEKAADRYATVAGFYALAEKIEEFKQTTAKSVWQKCTGW